MKTLKRITRLLAIAGLVLGFATCVSAQVTWTLNDVTFDNGDTVTGSFTTNSAVNAILSESITITGPHAFAVNVLADAYLPNTIGIASAGWNQYIDLYLASPLTGAGGTIPISLGFDCPGCGTLDTAAQGHDPVVIGTTPEPATGALLLLGLGLMMGRRFAQRRRRATETNQS